MTEVSFRRLPAILCLYWQVYLRWGKKNKIVVVFVLSDSNSGSPIGSFFYITLLSWKFLLNWYNFFKPFLETEYSCCVPRFPLSATAVATKLLTVKLYSLYVKELVVGVGFGVVNLETFYLRIRNPGYKEEQEAYWKFHKFELSSKESEKTISCYLISLVLYWSLTLAENCITKYC